MKDDILIDKYLKGLLSKDEEESFLERLNSDVLFKENFELEKELFNVLNEEEWSYAKNLSEEVHDYKRLLDESDIQDLKRTLDKVNSSQKTVSKRANIKLLYYLAAASIVVFMVFQFFFNQKISNQELYKEYASLSDLPSFTTRNITDSTGAKLVRAEKLFDSKNYKEALAIFKPIIETDQSDIFIFLYAGISQTELEKYAEAETTFNILIDSELSNANVGYWYKALLFLKQDRVGDASKILKKIVSKNLFNKDKAEELLEALN
ncbi:hypothetical protein [uncultured Winogradskyella sp.]|uniref:hypothetical protein n=1 Tax=uncultured Winogradskyella sp. TaxID=395353 RepID=UPI002622C67A|nr:hypothetical protein [uncultured Winogradskyella sp.]